MEYFDKNKKIILDVDTGIDDALAIILLCKYFPKNILGITACGGNVDVELVAKNSLEILSLLDLDIPVYVGSGKPLKKVKYITALDYHGANGLCNVEILSRFEPQKKDAVDFIIESAKRYKDDLTIISLAPLTNIAKAILKDESIKRDIKKIVIMGGAVDIPGNQTKYAEFNFFQDPESVKVVFEALAFSIRLVPLDVTHKCLISKGDLDRFGEDKISRFVFEAIRNWYDFFGDPKERKFELYDPLAVGAILGDFLEFKKVKLGVCVDGERSGGILHDDNGKEIRCALSVRGDDFLKFFWDSMNK